MSDGQQIENLLVGNEEAAAGARERGRGADNNDDDDEPAIGGIDHDDFVIPGTAQTAQPFLSQGGGEFGPTNDDAGAVAAETNGDEHAHDDDPQPMDAAAAADDAFGAFDGHNLIEAPVQINAINLEYAKTAKNIDVRRLKHIIWTLLCEESAELEKVSDRLSFIVLVVSS